MQVALVLWVNGHGSVAEHGFRARRGNGEKLAGVFAIGAEDRVLDLPQMALVLGVNDFEIADSGLAAWAPIDDVRTAVDESLMVEADEGLPDRDRQALVHG